MIDAPTNRRPIAVITGAGGGMGRVCASRLADRYALVLCEFRKDALDQIARQLSDEGADVIAAVPGDLCSEAVLQSIVAACADRPLRAMVHTAGLSPDTGGWQDILKTNLVATARLLDAIEPLVGAGFVAALIASMARLAVSAPPEGLLELLEDPLAEDLVQRFAPLLGEDEALFGNPAYCWSKWWVAREAGRRALTWGPRGARIMSISPGMIYTPMGRVAAGHPEIRELVDNTPAGRWGTPADIANAVEFILSDKAGFITGSDILVDGGVSAYTQAGLRGRSGTPLSATAVSR
jgi:NAD(P)-dependent dehydrogenase (short-subunit alcohol dehydrogenase family)